MYSIARTKMKLEEKTVNVGGKEIKVFYDVNGIYQKNEGEYLQSVINTPKGLKINKTDKYTSVGRNVGDYASEFVMDMRTVSPESEYSLFVENLDDSYNDMPIMWGTDATLLKEKYNKAITDYSQTENIDKLVFVNQFKNFYEALKRYKDIGEKKFGKTFASMGIELKEMCFKEDEENKLIDVSFEFNFDKDYNIGTVYISADLGEYIHEHPIIENLDELDKDEGYLFGEMSFETLCELLNITVSDFSNMKIKFDESDVDYASFKDEISTYTSGEPFENGLWVLETFGSKRFFINFEIESEDDKYYYCNGKKLAKKNEYDKNALAKVTRVEKYTFYGKDLSKLSKLLEKTYKKYILT